jgi:hypothetical protein
MGVKPGSKPNTSSDAAKASPSTNPPTDSNGEPRALR